jgi:nucleotide-binding universal stress UspA family protein
LHVVEPIHIPVDVAVGVPSLLPYDQAVLDKARENLEKLVDVPTRALIEVECRVVEGVAFAEIVRIARDEEIGLIVIATHGLSGIAHLLLGSTTEKVVRKAPCPVLTVKHPEHDFVMP